MIRRSLILFLLCIGNLLAEDWPHAKNTQKAGEHPPGPSEQVQMMTVPEGFQVTLFAGEPAVRQPVAFTFDDRGRLWVLECYTYTGKKEFDLEKRDRVVILEDTDGDGRFDQRKVFWDEGQRAFGIEWGQGGLWILQAPYLSFLPDRDFDDVPDGPVEHKIDGFTVKAAHNNVNGLRWGPDGWLWGRHGITKPSKGAIVGTPDDEREEFKSNIWRYHTVKNKFELVCRGGINPWGFDWNDEGEMFFTNNVNGQLFHLIPGARYRVNFVPSHDAAQQPFLGQCADHQHFDYGKVWHQSRSGATTSELGGGHSHCGGMIYLADNWPKEYRGRVFLHNTHGKRVNMEILERKGSGYVARHGEDFLKANNDWYRGVELKYGPGGAVYMLDWSDHGECHDHDGVHRGSGRIYKVRYGKREEQVRFDLREFTDAQLVELQLFDNDWWVRHARRILQERALAGTLDAETVKADLLRIYRHPDVTRRLRALWCLYSSDLVDNDWIHVQLRDQNEHIRAWALRLLGDHGLGYGRVRLIFSRISRDDPSPLVRAHLAGLLQKIPIGHRLEVLVPLGQHEEDIGDPNLPLMIWFAAEDSIDRTPDLAIELARTTVHRLTRRLVARKIAANRGRKPEALSDLIGALGEIEDEGRQGDLLDGVLDALSGARRVEVPASWSAIHERLVRTASDEIGDKLAELAVVFSDLAALRQFRMIASDEGAGIAKRRRALEVLVKAGAPDLGDLLNKALEIEGLGVPAMRGLAASGEREAGARIVKRYAMFSVREKRVAMTILSSRREFASLLLDAIESGTVQARELTAFDARQIQSLGERDLQRRLAMLWGTIRTAKPEKKKELERLRSVISSPSAVAVDRLRGRTHFEQRCVACHTLWGEGGHAGPDLTGSDRRNLDYLLENVIDPSASVPQNYRLTIVTLKDGQKLSGFVEEDLGSLLRLRAQDQMHHLSSDRIAKREVMNSSLMPEGLLNGMSDAEIRDLFAYLRGREPVK
jgi:putative membrane-bound dehydrogenase-like protein